MNWDVIKGNWTQAKGKIRQEWGELTDDDSERIAGDKDILLGKLQEKYGWTKEEALKRVDDFSGRFSVK